MKKLPGLLIALVISICLISTAACNKAVLTPTPEPTIQPGDSTRRVFVHNEKRRYHIHIPPGINRMRPVPVVFVFHGWDMVPLQMEEMTGFDHLADKNGFLTVYPWGIGLSWNGGDCCGIAAVKNVDERAFVHQILSDLKTIAHIDHKRIYATGISNGGMLSYRLGCEMSTTFAAIAPVAGVLWYSPCQPRRPVSVMHVHDKIYDTIVPYAGGKSDLEGLITPVPPGGWIFPSVEQGIATWVQLDGCSASPRVEQNGQITHIVYTSCQAGTTVELYLVDGFGHDWPQQPTWPASEKIWEFFAAHPKP